MKDKERQGETESIKLLINTDNRIYRNEIRNWLRNNCQRQPFHFAIPKLTHRSTLANKSLSNGRSEKRTFLRRVVISRAIVIKKR